MVKYCIYCGQPNDDLALFCTSCGKGFPAQTPPPPSSAEPFIELIEEHPSGSYTADMEPGIHQHMRTDVYLRDSGSQVVLVAKLQSLLHKNYAVVDGTGVTKGQIVQKNHLTHVTYGFEDEGSNTLGMVNVSNVQQGHAPRSCWIEDASGNRLASIVYSGAMSFSALGTNESSLFDVYPSGDGGIRSAFSAVVSGSYTIQLNDATFPLPMVLTTIAALAAT